MIVLTSTKEKCLEISLAYPSVDFYDFPCIEYSEPKDAYLSLDASIRSNHLYEWVFFLSPKSAEVYFERLIAIGGNFFNLSNHLKFAVIGQATKDFLENEINMPVDFMPSQANSKTFVDEFCSQYHFDFDCAFKVLLPRSELAQDDFKEQLEASKNYDLDIVPAYNTVIASKSAEELLDFKLKLAEIKGVIFTSSSCVDNFFELTSDYDLSSKAFYSIGSKTSKTIMKNYPTHKALFEADEASIDSIVNAIC